MNGPTAAAEVSLAMIESGAKQFADKHQDLAGIVQLLNDQVEAMKRAALPDIKRAVVRAAEAHAKLFNLVESAPGLFVSPKTITFHGIKVGYRKGSGGIEWDDPDKVVELIEKHFSAARAELLIKTTKKPIKGAIEDLDVSDLKKIGCRVEATSDVVVIKATDSGVDKIVTALLKEATADENSNQ